jgi:protein-tyrosine phosphatase
VTQVAADVRVLMVCLGNICRSPTAEAAVREAAQAAGVDLHVDSAGTGAWHVGEPPDRRMTAAAAEDGLHLGGAARQVTVDDFDRFDLVIAMDRSNLRDLERLAPDDDARARLRLFRDYAGETGQDVPDPYYGGPDGFREVVALVRRAATGLVDAIADGSA